MKNLSNPSRRAFTGWLATAAFAGVATQSVAGSYRGGGTDPFDRVPQYYSVREFTELSRNQVYRINQATRFGRPVRIGDLTPSQTRELLREALADWPGPFL